MPQNTLYYSDNLDVVKKHFEPETVDLAPKEKGREEQRNLERAA